MTYADDPSYEIGGYDAETGEPWYRPIIPQRAGDTNEHTPNNQFNVALNQARALVGVDQD